MPASTTQHEAPTGTVHTSYYARLLPNPGWENTLIEDFENLRYFADSWLKGLSVLAAHGWQAEVLEDFRDEEYLQVIHMSFHRENVQWATALSEIEEAFEASDGRLALGPDFEKDFDED